VRRRWCAAVVDGRRYVPGGADHSRPWAPQASPPAPVNPDPGWIFAGLPTYAKDAERLPPQRMQHLFRRAGEWSVCGELNWLQVQRANEVTEYTWVCAACKAKIMADSGADPTVEVVPDDDGDGVAADGSVVDVRCGVCPTCRGRLTDPKRSAGGWRHCRTCRRGWGVLTRDRSTRTIWRDWPAEAAMPAESPAQRSAP